MLPRYRGVIVLREPAPPARPASSSPRKLYPQWRNIYGELVCDHKVTIEQEIAEIRARHAAYREYNRVRWAAAREARQSRIICVSTDHSALVESDA